MSWRDQVESSFTKEYLIFLKRVGVLKQAETWRRNSFEKSRREKVVYEGKKESDERNVWKYIKETPRRKTSQINYGSISSW